MAAGITIRNDKTAEMFYTGARPWHGLGTKLDTYATSAQALEAAGLNWTVSKRPIFYPKGDTLAPMLKAPEHFMVVRDDNEEPLGAVGENYTPLQNMEAFSFMDAIIGEKAAVYETAGSLWGGRRVWALAKLDGVMRVKGEDVLDRYLLLSNGHDGWQAVRVALTSVRVVCNNTLTSALAGAKMEGTSVKLRHSRGIGAKVERVRVSLGMVNKAWAQIEEQAQRLAEVKVTGATLESFLKGMGFDPKDAKTQDKALDLVKAFETGPGSELESAKGTLWGAVNAVTYYVDHARGWQSRSADAESARFADLMVGAGARLKGKAWDLALKMAK